MIQDLIFLTCLHGLSPNCPPLLSIETVSITVFSLLPDPGSFLWPRHPVRHREIACEKAVWVTKPSTYVGQAGLR